jgi:hypothetical protein
VKASDAVNLALTYADKVDRETRANFPPAERERCELLPCATLRSSGGGCPGWRGTWVIGDSLAPEPLAKNGLRLCDWPQRLVGERAACALEMRCL